MRKLLFVLGCFVSFTLLAQQPQFAVVRPSGTSYMCPTWDSAYNKAVDGDFIYLPGGSFTFNIPINKKLYLFGAGYSEDSTKSTGVTMVNGFAIKSGGSNGSVEGLLINGKLQLDTNLINYSVRFCNIKGGIGFGISCSNINISNNDIGGTGGNLYYSLTGGSLSNSLFTNNIIAYTIQPFSSTGNTFLNNLFFGSYYYQPNFNLLDNCIYRNNIFTTFYSYACSNSAFNNNINATINTTYGNSGSGNISESVSTTFVNPGTPFNGFYSYSSDNDYLLQPNSLAHSAGTDGKDLGIYGGQFPWKKGNLPSNPHIYFKQIDSQTGTNGTLKIQVKVRTNN